MSYINSECTGMHTHLIDKLPSLVRYMNPGSSIMADKLIHELGHTFSTFPYQGLRLNEFTGVVYAGDDGVVPLWSLRKVGDEINAKLSPGFKRYIYGFQLISTVQITLTVLYLAFLSSITVRFLPFSVRNS